MGSLFAAVVTCVRTARSMSCTHIARRGRLLFSHSRGCIVQRETPSGEHPRLRASCSVVAKAVEWTATPAGASGQGQLQRETTSEQDSEEDRLDLSEGRSNKADCTSGTRGVVCNSIWCFLLFCLQLWAHEILMAQRASQHFDASLMCWHFGPFPVSRVRVQQFNSLPHLRKDAVPFPTRSKCLSWVLILACSQNSTSGPWCTSATPSRLVTM